MKPTFSLLALLLVFLSASCKKEEVDALPDATQEGKNTFGCLVDGKAFLPKPASAISINNREPLEGLIYQEYLSISARGDGGVDIILRNAFRPGNYALADVSSGSNGYYKIGSSQYFTDATHTGTVTLTRIDTIQKIASGTFQFSASGVSAATGKTVTVTDGRFDVRLK